MFQTFVLFLVQNYNLPPTHCRFVAVSVQICPLMAASVGFAFVNFPNFFDNQYKNFRLIIVNVCLLGCFLPKMSTFKAFHPYLGWEFRHSRGLKIRFSWLTAASTLQNWYFLPDSYSLSGDKGAVIP